MSVIDPSDEPTIHDAWSADSLELLYSIYRSWADQRRPPNLGDLHAATGFSYRDLRRRLRELQEGFAVSVSDDRIQLGITKAPPFSATATPVKCFVAGEFVSYLGCPAEVMTVGGLPMYQNVELQISSYCGCCFEPIEVVVKGSDVVSPDPVEPIIVVVGSPWEWEQGVPPERVCDTIHFVRDAEHGERFGRLVGRRHVLVTMGQMGTIAAPLASQRMRDPYWAPLRIDAERYIGAFDAAGVDVSNWR